jgi:hypothetical protein
MSEADQLLLQILERGNIVGRDAAGRTIIQLTLDDVTLDKLMVFGADLAEGEDGCDDEPYEVPPVHACWLDAA